MTEQKDDLQPMLELRRGGASGVRRLRPPGRSCRGATKAPAMEKKMPNKAQRSSASFEAAKGVLTLYYAGVSVYSVTIREPRGDRC